MRSFTPLLEICRPVTITMPYHLKSYSKRLTSTSRSRTSLTLLAAENPPTSLKPESVPVPNSSQRRNLLAVIQLITYRPPFRVGHGQFEVDSVVVDVKGTKVAVDC